MNDEQKLGKGIVTILIVNIINAVFQLILGFFVPKVLNVDVYGEYKFYQMLVGYTGLFHLGFIDGVYLEFGGKGIMSISSRRFNEMLVTLATMELLLSGLVLLVSFFISDIATFCFGLQLLPANLVFFHQLVYQATGEFQAYGKIKNIESILAFVLIGGATIIGAQKSYVFMMLSVVQTWIVLAFSRKKTLVRKTRDKVGFIERVEICTQMVKSGFWVMVGTLSFIILTTIDRWFIKALMPVSDFAKYSFAVSILSLLSVIITPVSITFYNFFCNHGDKDAIANKEKQVYLFSTIIISIAFPLRFIVELFLEKYQDAIDVLGFLIVAICFNTVISCVFINVFNAKKMQFVFSRLMLVSIVFGVVADVVFYYIMNNKEALAIATVFTTVFLFILCKIRIKESILTFRAELYLVLQNVVFLVLWFLADAMLGFVLYFVLTVLLSHFLMKNVGKSLIVFAWNNIRKRFKSVDQI